MRHRGEIETPRDQGGRTLGSLGTIDAFPILSHDHPVYDTNSTAVGDSVGKMQRWIFEITAIPFGSSPGFTGGGGVAGAGAGPERGGGFLVGTA